MIATKKLAFTLAAVLIGFAFAQEAEPATGVAAWFASAAAFAGLVIVPVVSFLKTNVLKEMHGWATIGVSFAVGIAGGIAGSFAGYLEGIQAGLVFGLSAGLIASGGWDAISGLLGKRQATS